jgi:hypothetical protein
VTMEVTAERGRRTAQDVGVLLTAKWYGPERPGDLSENIDHRSLPWYESVGLSGPVTSFHLAPGIFRRIELFKVGPPASLHTLMGWPEPASESRFVQGLVAAIFAAPPYPESPTSEPFLHSHLAYILRFDVTARDVDSVTYETEVRVRTIGPSMRRLELRK